MIHTLWHDLIVPAALVWISRYGTHCILAHVKFIACFWICCVNWRNGSRRRQAAFLGIGVRGCGKMKIVADIYLIWQFYVADS